MLNYLEILQRTNRECGYSGSGPTAITGLTGQYQLVQDAVDTAWREIQNYRSGIAAWDWMRKPFTFNTTIAKSNYTLTDLSLRPEDDHANALGFWDTKSFSMYLTADGVTARGFLPYRTFPFWRDNYWSRGIADTRPVYFTVDKSNRSLHLMPGPDAVYTVDGYYYRRAYDMIETDEEPDIPEEHVDMIFWKAVVSRGADDESVTAAIRAAMAYNDHLEQMEKNYLPETHLGTLKINARPIA